MINHGRTKTQIPISEKGRQNSYRQNTEEPLTNSQNPRTNTTQTRTRRLTKMQDLEDTAGQHTKQSSFTPESVTDCSEDEGIVRVDSDRYIYICIYIYIYLRPSHKTLSLRLWCLYFFAVFVLLALWGKETLSLSLSLFNSTRKESGKRGKKINHG